jgi:hypothetical protein
VVVSTASTWLTSDHRLATSLIASGSRLLHEVGDQRDRHAPVADALDELPRVAPGLRVEAGGELVEHGHLRVADQRERDRQTLLLSTGQPPELGVELAGEVGGAAINQSVDAGVSMVTACRCMVLSVPHDSIGP